MYIDFISIAMDPDRQNHAAKYHQLSRGQVNVRWSSAPQGRDGMRNSSQHSQSLENWFVNVPGLICRYACDPCDVKGC